MNKIKVMGILNLTPDSFFDGGKYNSIDNALKHAENLINDGADIIDIGGESTRPYSKQISSEEEIKRVIPILKEIRNSYKDVILSIDTTKSEVMEKSIENGVDIINDVSGLMWDKKSIEIVKESQKPVVIMHSPWKPHEMQDKYSYPNGVLADIISFFNERLNTLTNFGIKKENIILDPGVGFGKSINDNFEIISNLGLLKKIGQPVLLGASNKSYIFQTTGDKTLKNRVEGNVITEFFAIKNNVDNIRVHDVASTIRTIKISSSFFKNPVL